MRVVKSHQTFPVRTVQRERVVYAVRLRFARRNTVDREAYPVPGLRIDDQDLPVEFEQRVQGRVALHDLSLSHNDNEGVMASLAPICLA